MFIQKAFENSKGISDNKQEVIRAGGVIGKHAVLRWLCSEERGGSTPLPPTKTMGEILEIYRKFEKLAAGIFLVVIASVLVVLMAIYFLRTKPSSPVLQCLTPQKGIVTKIIDGDTIIVEGGFNVRLLGMDADEKGYPCFDEAKKRLEDLILNQEVKLEKDVTDVDQYKRCLRYVFLGEKNIDLELVKEGLAVARFYEPDLKYHDQITAAEKTAIENKVGCKWSESKPTPSLSTPQEFKNLTPANTGLEVIFACNAGNYSGKEIIVEGRVTDAYRSKTNTVFLNFEKPNPNQCFTAVIFSSEQYKFVDDPEKYYAQKTVRVRGKIKNYQGKPEIILEDPRKIEAGK